MSFPLQITVKNARLRWCPYEDYFCSVARGRFRRCPKASGRTSTVLATEMLDVAVASIIVAAVSLIGALGAAALATYTSYRADKLKREDESINIVKKYQDPLLIAAVTLRHKLVQFRNTHRILNTDQIPKKPVIPAQTYESKGTRPKPTADYALMYTAFLIGQYFASVHILRMESQFLSMQRAPKTKSLMGAYMEIESAWSDPDQQHPRRHDPDSQDDRDCLALWRGQQSAIGELMTDTETRSCIGYAKFRDFWYTKEEFKDWFGKGFTGPSFINKFESHRLKRVIGGLDAVIEILDPENLYRDAYERKRLGGGSNSYTPAQSDQKGGATSGHGVSDSRSPTQSNQKGGATSGHGVSDSRSPAQSDQKGGATSGHGVSDSRSSAQSDQIHDENMSRYQPLRLDSE